MEPSSTLRAPSSVECVEVDVLTLTTEVWIAMQMFSRIFRAYVTNALDAALKHQVSHLNKPRVPVPHNWSRIWKSTIHALQVSNMSRVKMYSQFTTAWINFAICLSAYLSLKRPAKHDFLNYMYVTDGLRCALENVCWKRLKASVQYVIERTKEQQFQGWLLEMFGLLIRWCKMFDSCWIL